MGEPPIKDGRHEREVDLFDRACDLPAAEREAFLDGECAGDPGLRSRIARLLERDAQPETEIDRPAVSALVGAPASPEVPERIGGYRILEVLGRGGMGVVYLAEQESPKRRVALKVLRPGLLDRALLRRFEHEALALGWLSHPGIAQIYEAGLAETSRGPEPFLAMEWVRGEPLTRYADRRGLSVKERLELLARVCDAVEHAHQKGVIHRDLKPGNILVEENGQPKVLDFGVARITQSDLRATTLHTRVGEIVGTLAYMSPEQLSGRPEEVDTRCDVYALGVIAYEMLSGRLPHDLGGKSLPEATRLLVEEEPARLSSVRRELRGDVSTIVAKGIEKEKERRYASARDLGGDLRRVLRDEPILARPTSGFYQLRKFARRNKGLTVGVSAAALALVAGTIVSLRQVGIANAARDLADQRKEIAEKERGHAQRSAYRATIAAASEAAEHEEFAAFRRLLESVAPADRNWEWRHLATLADRALAHVEGAGPILDARLDPSGKELSVVTATGEVERWDVDLLERLGTVRLDPPLAGPAGISPDGTRLAGLLEPEGRAVGLWDLATGRRVAEAATGGATPTCLALAPQGARVAIGGTRSLLWNPADPGAPIALHAPFATAFAFSGDGRRLASGYSVSSFTRAGFVLDYEAGTGASSHRAPSHATSPVGDVAMNPEGSRIAIAYGDKLVRVHDARENRLLLELAGHTAPVRSVAFDSGGDRLASASDDETVRLWNPQTGAPLGVLAGLSGKPRDVGFSGDGSRVFARTERGIDVWSTESADGVLRGQPSYVYAVAFVAGGARFVSGSFDGTIRLWDSRSGDPLWGRRPAEGRIFAVAAASAAPLFASAHGALVRLWDADGGEVLRQFEVERGEAVFDLGLSADGSLLAARRASGVTLWSTRTGKTLRTWSCHSATNYPAVSISPGGERVAADCGVGPIVLWSVGTGEEITRLLGHSGSVEGLAFSADGSLLASGGVDRTVRVWDGHTGASRWSSPGHADRVYALAFSPDGSRLASGSNDTTVRLWDVDSGEGVALLRGHSDYVFSLAFSPDGSRLVSASGDRTLRIWDTEPTRTRWPAAVRSRRARAEAEPAVRALLEAEPDRARSTNRLREDPSLDPLRREASIQALLRLGGEPGGR